VIHDPKIEITCDGKNCNEYVEYEMPWVYHTYSGDSGHYGSNEADTESFLVGEEWIVKDKKHFCHEGCAEI